MWNILSKLKQWISNIRANTQSSLSLLSPIPTQFTVDPLPNGCHKTRNIPWLATLSEQNSLCLSVRAFVCVHATVLCVAHRATSLPDWCWEETQRRWQTRQSLPCLSSVPLLDSSFLFKIAFPQGMPCFKCANTQGQVDPLMWWWKPFCPN